MLAIAEHSRADSSIVVRGSVPASMKIDAAPRGRAAAKTLRTRIADAVRAFRRRHGVMPEEIEIDGHPFGIAGVCVNHECGSLVLASDNGAAIPLCDACR